MRRRNVGIPVDITQVKLLLSVEEAAAVLSVGRSLVYDLVMHGDIPSIKVRRMRRIPLHALQAYIDRQLAQAS